MKLHQFSIFSLVIFVLILSPKFLLAEKSETTEATYIDLDGDGINDNAPDSDGDGIIDVAESGFRPGQFDTEPANMGIVSFETSSVGISADPSLNSGKFSSLNKNCRLLSSNRGGFGIGDQFGPGNGIGIGAVSSGGCAGGVCH